MTPELETQWRAEFDAWYLKKYPLVEGYGDVSDQIRHIKENDEWPAYLAAKRADAEEIARLREALTQAADALDIAHENIADWGFYANKYFQDKWNLQGDIDNSKADARAARAAIAQPPAAVKEHNHEP